MKQDVEATGLREENKMGTMPVNGLLLSMAVPIMIAMLIQALYNIVDSMFVARISEDALTAVSIAFPVQNLIIAIAGGTSVGVNSLLSKSLGEKNFEESDRAANNGIFLMFLNFLVFLIFGLFFVPAYYRMQTQSSLIISYGHSYLSICLCFSFGIFGQFIFERLLQATGKTIYTMISQALGAILNIILDPLLIFGLFGLPKMGIAGAAIATVISQIIAAGICLYFNIRKNHEVRLRLRGFRPNLKTIKRIYIVGVPSILMGSIGSVMVFFLNKILISFSSTATAVFGVYFKLQSFVFMPIFGLNNAMVPIIAYNYGARKKERIIQTIKLSITYAVSISLLGLLLFQIFPSGLLLLFDASADMLAIGVPALRIISLSYLFAGFGIVCSSVYQAFGQGFHSLAVSVGRQLAVLVPAAYILAWAGGLQLIWWAFPIAEIASVLLSLLFLKSLYQKHIKPLPAA